MSIPPTERVQVVCRADGQVADTLRAMEELILLFVRGDALQLNPVSVPEPSGRAFLAGGIEVYVPLGGLIDLNSEVRRLQKEAGRLEELIRAKERLLADERFLSRAPGHVVEAERRRLEEYRGKYEKVRTTLKKFLES